MAAQSRNEDKTQAKAPEGTPIDVYKSDAKDGTHADGSYSHPVGGRRNLLSSASRTGPVKRFTRSSDSRNVGDRKILVERRSGSDGLLPAQTPFDQAARDQARKFRRDPEF